MKILKIDDSLEISKLHKEMLSAKNHSIRCVNGGKEGLELVVKNDFDLIILDMYMPKYSGMDFLRDLKNQRPSELKKVIVLSMLQFSESQTEELLKFGIHSVEEKHSNLQKLEAIVKHRL